MTRDTGKRYSDSVRARIRHLRSGGKPIKQLAKMVGTSPATVAYWTRDIRLTTEQNAINLLNTLPDPMRGGRAHHEKSLAQKARWGVEAEEEFPRLIQEPLFALGIGLYWGEGGKATRNAFQLTNSDPALARVWLQWCSRYAPEMPLRLSLWLHPEVPKDFAIQYWLKELGYPKDTNLACTVRKGPATSYAGNVSLGTIKISGGVGATRMLAKMLRWIELSVSLRDAPTQMSI